MAGEITAVLLMLAAAAAGIVLLDLVLSNVAEAFEEGAPDESSAGRGGSNAAGSGNAHKQAPVRTQESPQ